VARHFSCSHCIEDGIVVPAKAGAQGRLQTACPGFPHPWERRVIRLALWLKVERRTIAVLVDNESGILARVVGLFSGRGCNIESLTVAEVDRKNRVADH